MRKVKCIEYKKGKKITRLIPSDLMWEYTGAKNNFLINIGREPIHRDWNIYNIYDK